jgi:hypothetical protein
LTKIETATEIETDIQARKCSFRVDPSVDYQTKLAEFAKTNTHLAGYTMEQ